LAGTIVKQGKGSIHIILIKKMFEAVINFYIVWGAGAQKNKRQKTIDNGFHSINFGKGNALYM